MSSEDFVTVTSNNGVRFNARIIRKGDRYGLNDCLTVGEGNSLRLEGPGPFVEFYDARFPHTRFGQFVARYGVDTILSHVGVLDLHSGVNDWWIDGSAMRVIREWVRSESSRTYSVGIPTAVTVHRDGRVTLDFDLSEIEDFRDIEHDYLDSEIEDSLVVSAAADTINRTHTITL